MGEGPPVNTAESREGRAGHLERGKDNVAWRGGVLKSRIDVKGLCLTRKEKRLVLFSPDLYYCVM